MDRCAICGTPVPENDQAEMYDAVMIGMYGDQLTPEQEAQYAGYVHASCGLARGWEVA